VDDGSDWTGRSRGVHVIASLVGSIETFKNVEKMMSKVNSDVNLVDEGSDWKEKSRDGRAIS